MALKNTYLTKGAGYYINLAQEALVKAGASGFFPQSLESSSLDLLEDLPLILEINGIKYKRV